MTKVTDALSDEGPLTAEEMPHRPNPRDRMDGGVRTFKVEGSRGASKASVPRTTGQVFYIDRIHSPREVVAAWLDANPEFLDANDPWPAYRTMESAASGESWRQAIRHELEGRLGEDVFHGQNPA